MAKMSRDVLTTAVRELLGGDLADIPLDRLYHLIPITRHATDLLLDEIERRGELAFRGSLPIVPYSDPQHHTAHGQRLQDAPLLLG
jgi:hypothetical protein